MGDFNHGRIQWKSQQSTGSEDQKFLNLVQDSFLTQHVLEPTRGENILDIVLSSQKEFIDNVRICEPLGCSDHNQIYFIIKVKGEQNRKIRYRKNVHKGRYKDMRKHLAKIDWNNTLENKTATECWNILKREIDCIVEQFVPLKKQGKRSKKKHLSKEAIRKIKYKQTMWKTYRHNGSEDLGLTISADMKVSEQCAIAAAKGNQILGLIRRNIVYKEKELIIPLYKTIVRPHLEYCIQAWRPYRKKDIDILERVQRRATKMIQKLRNISYEMRLKECGLTTLEIRRLRGDQIEVFKILNWYENIDRNIFFSVKEERRTRGHGITLAKKQCRLDIRKKLFSQRTVNEWNRLSADCVGASSVNMF